MNKKYYANREDFENNKPNMIIEHVKGKFYDTEIEIKIVEPVYEYQVLFSISPSERFGISSNHYLDKHEFEASTDSRTFIELYLPSKRERKNEQ